MKRLDLKWTIDGGFSCRKGKSTGHSGLQALISSVQI